MVLSSCEKIVQINLNVFTLILTKELFCPLRSKQFWTSSMKKSCSILTLICKAVRTSASTTDIWLNYPRFPAIFWLLDQRQKRKMASKQRNCWWFLTKPGPNNMENCLNVVLVMLDWGWFIYSILSRQPRRFLLTISFSCLTIKNQAIVKQC